MEKTIVESYLRAGEIAKKVRIFAKESVKKDMLLVEIAEKIESKIKELGGEWAFPVNLSLNEIAAHYTPGKSDRTRAEGLLTVDFGVAVNGCIADTALSIDLDGKYAEMIKLNDFILEEALKKVNIGTKVGEIGTCIQEEVEKYNRKNGKKYSVIRNLTGHSLGENTVHAGLTVSNIKNDSSIELRDIAIAIEPFLTEGMGEIYEGKPGEIFMWIMDGKPRDADARVILNFIKSQYKTRPFCKRWLENAGLKKIDFSLSLLVKSGILHNFPILIERGRMPVSQSEHTVLITDKTQVITK
jgi:methionyl aminopeptidase